jgi:hypothetical protein
MGAAVIAGKSFAREGEVVGQVTHALFSASGATPTTTLAGREATLCVRRSASTDMPPPVSNPREGRWARKPLLERADIWVPGDSFGSDANVRMSGSSDEAMRATVFNSSGGHSACALKRQFVGAPAGSLSDEEAPMVARESAPSRIPLVGPNSGSGQRTCARKRHELDALPDTLSRHIGGGNA